MTPTQRARVVVLVWLGVMGVLVLGLMREARLGGSLTAFLPRSGSIVQRALVQGLHKGEAARLLLVSITGATAAARERASAALVPLLHRHSRCFTLIANGGHGTTRGFTRFLFRHRYLLAPRTSWSVAALHADLERALAVLASPAGLGAGRMLADPTGAFMASVKPWLRNTGPATQDGVWVSRHHKAALLLVETRQSGFSVAAQRRAVALVRQAFAQVAAKTTLHLELGGTGAITVAANDRVARNAQVLTIIDVLLVAAILLFVYRSWPPLVASLVPLVTGGLTAALTAALLFTHLTVTTLGFGTMLIGVAMDYPAYVLLHTGRSEHVAAAARRVGPALMLAMAAMVIGFATMTVSHLAGLVQLGVFASVGLVAAALAARFLLPLMMPTWTQGSSLAVFDQRAHVAMGVLRRGGWVVIVACIAAVLFLAAEGRRVWDNHVSALSPAPPALMRQTGALAREFGVPGLSSLLVIVGSNRQVVLARSAALVPTLVQLRKAGALTGFDLAERYLPSAAVQRRRQRALPTRAQLAARLRVASRGLPFRLRSFRPFLRAVHAARVAPVLTYAALPPAIRARIAALLTTIHGHSVAFVHLTGVRKPAAIVRALAQSGVKDVHFVKVKRAVGRLLGRYRNALLWHSAWAVLFIALVLTWGLRSFVGTLRLLLPMGAAVLVTCAFLVLIGHGLTLLNVVALLLIVGLGMGYALFLGDNGLIHGRRAVAPWVCAATTMTGFGVMAFAQVPLLQSVGLTVSVGALLALLFTAAWSRPDGNSGSGV